MGPAAATAGLKGIEAAMQYAQIAFLWLIILALPNPAANHAPVRARARARDGKRWQSLVWRPTRGWALATGAAGACAVMAIAGTTEFVYFQFLIA